MTLFWTTVLVIVVIAALVTLFDLFRRGYPRRTTVGWAIVILLLPLIGSVIYWVRRQPTQREGEELYQAQTELRREAARRSPDNTRIGP